MSLIARILTGLLMGSAWLLGPERAEWLEGLVVEATETREGRGRVAWLLGGIWLVAGELLRRSAIRALTFIAAAGIVVWVVWPGSSSDYAVADRDRDRDAHWRGDVRTLQLSPLERGEGNVARGPGVGMVGVRRTWATPTDGLRGCTTRGSRHAREWHDSRPTGKLGCRVRHRNGGPCAGGAHRGHDCNLPPEGGAPEARPDERCVRNVRPRPPHDPAQPQTGVLGRTQHRPSRRSIRRYRLDARHRTDARAVRRRSRRRPRRSVTPSQPPRLPAPRWATRTGPDVDLNAG